MLWKTRHYEQHCHQIDGLEARLMGAIAELREMTQRRVLGDRDAFERAVELFDKAAKGLKAVADDERELCEEAVREIEDAD